VFKMTLEKLQISNVFVLILFTLIVRSKTFASQEEASRVYEETDHNEQQVRSLYAQMEELTSDILGLKDRESILQDDFEHLLNLHSKLDAELREVELKINLFDNRFVENNAVVKQELEQKSAEIANFKNTAWENERSIYQAENDIQALKKAHTSSNENADREIKHLQDLITSLNARVDGWRRNTDAAVTKIQQDVDTVRHQVSEHGVNLEQLSHKLNTSLHRNVKATDALFTNIDADLKFSFKSLESKLTSSEQTFLDRLASSQTHTDQRIHDAVTEMHVDIMVHYDDLKLEVDAMLTAFRHEIGNISSNTSQHDYPNFANNGISVRLSVLVSICLESSSIMYKLP